MDDPSVRTIGDSIFTSCDERGSMNCILEAMIHCHSQTDLRNTDFQPLVNFCLYESQNVRTGDEKQKTAPPRSSRAAMWTAQNKNV